MDCMSLHERLKTLPGIPEHLQFLQKDELDITEVGDGNLNDVIRISSKSDLSKSVILKYGPPFIKCLGPEYPLSPTRNRLEYKALDKFHELCPGLVPQPFYCEKKENLVIMEDLVDYRDMRKEILKGNLEMGAIMDIADFTLKLHKCTHKKILSTKAFNDMINTFKNEEMVNLTNQYVFTKPWIKDDQTNRSSEEVKSLFSLIYENENLLRNVKELRGKFLSQRECLLHGDLHTGSIMTKGCHAKIIDAEFAYIGPAGFDIGMLLANYLFSYHAHRSYPQNDMSDFHKTVKNATLNTINYYFDGMSAWLEDGDLIALISETVGFVGCELIRRIVGTAHVLELEEKPRAEVECVHLGVKLITGYQEVKTRDALISIMELD